MNTTRCHSLVITFGPPHDETGGKPWWWNQLVALGLERDVTYQRVSLGHKRSTQIGVRQLLQVFAKIVARLYRAGSRYDYVFTFECDLTSFSIALIQTLTLSRRPRHVILQFIMREKQPTLASRLKYLFMKFCFVSVHRVVCSSRPEMEYYRETFGWRPDKLLFVPFHTDPALLELPPGADDGFIIAAGRSLRDYETFLAAVDGLPVRVVVVAGRDLATRYHLPRNVELRCDIPLTKLNELIARSRVVVLPLEERRIATGQSVLLQAMTLAKPVVATRTAGTVDYVTHLDNGMLVEPRNVVALRQTIELLLTDDKLRGHLGKRALASVQGRYLPRHYIENLASTLTQTARQPATERHTGHHPKNDENLSQ